MFKSTDWTVVACSARAMVHSTLTDASGYEESLFRRLEQQSLHLSQAQGEHCSQL